MLYMLFDSPHQDESNGISFIKSSLLNKKKNNFYYFPKIENIVAESLFFKDLFLINEIPFDSYASSYLGVCVYRQKI
jgi:hypothetical protein